MNIHELLRDIKAGNLSHLYFLTGEEGYLIKEAQKALTKAVLGDDENAKTIFHRNPTVQELLVALETVPFFSERNLVIVKDTILFKSARKSEDEFGAKEGKESNKDAAEDRLITLFGNMPPYSYLIFTSAEKPDKRRKIYKAFEKNGAVVEALPLRGRDLREWLLNKINELNIRMTADAKEHLLTVVNMMPQTSLDFLESELEKIALYIMDGAENPIVTLPKLKEILAKAPEISIFAMIEALRQKELALTLELLSEELRKGRHPVQILALAAKQIGQLLTAKELLAKGYDSKQIAAHFKLPLFIGEKLARQSRNFPAAVLKKSLVDMADADYLLKSGKSGSYVLEKIMIELCGGRGENVGGTPFFHPSGTS